MMFKWLALSALVIAAAQSAAISDIPVRVVYEKLPEIQSPSLRNLHEKPGGESEEAAAGEKRLIGLKNLEERPQLSQDEQQTIAGKNLQRIVTPADAAAAEIINQNNNAAIIGQYQEQNIDDIYDKIQEIVLNGARRIETEVQKSNHSEKCKKDVMNRVNSTLENFLESSKAVLNNKSSTKQAPGAAGQPNQNVFQVLFSNFQTAANGLFSSFSNPPANTQGDEQPQPSIINQIQNFFSQMGSNIIGQNPAGQNTQSDEQPAQPQGPIQLVQSAVSNLQSNFNNFFRPNEAAAAPGSQADESSTPTNTNPIVGFITNLQSNFPNPFQPPAPPAAAAGSQADPAAAATTPGGPLAALQGAGQGIVSAIQANNPFAQTTASPNANNPLQAIAGVIPTNPNQISESISNLGQGASGGGGAGGNPIQQGQNIVNQIATQVSQAAGQAGAQAPAAPATPQQDQPQRPLQTVLQSINPFRRRTTVKPEENKDATTKKPEEKPISNEVTESEPPKAEAETKPEAATTE